MTEALYQPFPMPGRARGQVWRYAPQYRRPRHFHAEPELNLVVSGRGSFGVGRVVLPVEGGDLIAWLPGQDHELVEASDDFDLFVVGLKPELSHRVLRLQDATTPPGPARLSLPRDVVQRFTAICAVRWENEEPSAAETRIGDLWREAHALRASSPGMDPLSRRTLASVRQRLDRGRAELSRLLRACPGEVSRHFRAATGLTLINYRTRLRLLRFVDEVDGGRANLLEAALASGFGSYSQCHRAFRSAVGCSPRAFFEGGERSRMADHFAEPLAP